MTKKISLGSIDPDDLSTLREWRNTPEVYRWCRQYEPISLNSHLDWYSGLHKRNDLKMYAVRSCEPTGGVIVGVCGLTSIDWVNSRAEFSLYIGPSFQGKGYGKAALNALLDHGFKVLNLNCIWGESFEGNPAINMFLSLGFKHDGTRREFYFRDGKYIDALLFSKIRSEHG